MNDAKAMKDSVMRGLRDEGILPGELDVQKGKVALQKRASRRGDENENALTILFSRVIIKPKNRSHERTEGERQNVLVRFRQKRRVRVDRRSVQTEAL